MKIELRLIKEQDLVKIIAWRMSKEVTQFMYTDPVLTLDKQKEWFEKIKKDITCKYWIIVVDDIDIGLLGLTDIDFHNKRCNWLWYIGETEYRGKGIAQIIQLNIYDYVFYKLMLNKLYSEVLTVNVCNLKAYEKCEYFPEGILHEHIYKNQQFYDVAVCGITKSKWEEIKPKYKYCSISFEE